MRTIDSLRVGSEALLGTCIQIPGSKCMGAGVLSAFPVARFVTSLTVWTYDTPLRKMSVCLASPRFGIAPRGGPNVSFSVTKFNSRTLSLLTIGIAGMIGLGNVVVVGGPLLGRKIRLKPVPAKVPLKFSRTPNGGGTDSASEGLDVGFKLPSTLRIWKGASARPATPERKSSGLDMVLRVCMRFVREKVSDEVL